MTLPTGFYPYITSSRRRLFLLQRERTLTREDGPALAFQVRRLEQPGTPLWRRLPGRSTLLAAGVLAMEEVMGAGVDELRLYGLSRSTAERLITLLEGIPTTMPSFEHGPRVGQIYDQDEVTILASAARTASADSAVCEVGDRSSLRLDLDITAVAGTLPTLHVQIETREEYATGTWRVVDAFTLASSVSAQRKVFAGLDRHVKAVCTIGGTGSPSFTFSLTGEAV